MDHNPAFTMLALDCLADIMYTCPTDKKELFYGGTEFRAADKRAEDIDAGASCRGWQK